jgi:hypothetical protein
LVIKNPKALAATSCKLNDHIQMHMKLAVAILLIAAVPVYAQAQNRSGGKVSKRNSVPTQVER